MPVTQISGISNRNGHFGNPPPTAGISPQSQIVPSTVSCWKTCTSLCGCCAATSVPAINAGATACVAGPADVLAVSGSVAIAGVTLVVDEVDAVCVLVVGSCNAARSLSCCD